MSARTRALSARYGRDAALYRRYWAPPLVAFSEPILEEIRVQARAGVLDLGCGVGTIGALIARPSRARLATPAPVFGVDASEGMLGEALDNGLRASAGDITRLPFADDAFGAALSTFVLQHLPRAGAALREAARVVRPGGTIATATWGVDHHEDRGIYAVANEALDRAGAGPDPLQAVSWHDRVDSPEKMLRLGRAAGLGQARAWCAPGLYRWTPKTFMGYFRAMGPMGRRLATLDASARTVVLAEAKRGIESLAAADYAWRPDVVYFVATARKNR